MNEKYSDPLVAQRLIYECLVLLSSIRTNDVIRIFEETLEQHIHMIVQTIFMD